MARHFRHTGHILRFIEFMDVGTTNGWNLDEVLTSAQILQRITDEFPLEPVAAGYSGEVARRWRYTDQAGEIGLITSVSQPFCGSCTRGRSEEHTSELQSLMRISYAVFCLKKKKTKKQKREHAERTKNSDR